VQWLDFGAQWQRRRERATCLLRASTRSVESSTNGHDKTSGKQTVTLGLLWSMMSSGMRRTEGQYIRQSTVKCLNDLASRMGSCASLSTSSWTCLDVSIFSLEFLIIYGNENFVKKSTRWSEQFKAVWDMTGRFDLILNYFPIPHAIIGTSISCEKIRKRKWTDCPFRQWEWGNESLHERPTDNNRTHPCCY
jgi:hypothetical protein